MQVLDTLDSTFSSKFKAILNRGNIDMQNVSKIVSNLLDDIKNNGNEALLSHIRKFDEWNPESFKDIIIDTKDMQNAYNDISKSLREALKLAYDRIVSYHIKQKSKSWIDFEDNGTILGVKVTPVSRAGLYIPGGKAAYPSSLLMNAIPAIVAGVKEIAVCSPAPFNKPNNLLLAAMHICNISEAYKVGGASAIGFMAYGSGSMKKVDVITGPGNIYVACAKKLVFGDVNVDMIAGPSEIGIIADSSANVKYLAFDLLSQAEHDEMASSILVTNDRALVENLKNELDLRLKELKRYEITSKSIQNRGYIIITQSIEESINIMNEISPEHLEVLTSNSYELLPYITNAGAIFLGQYTPEAIGDYIAGPNHTLPTGGSAKFFSPLSIDNFIKKSSIISFSKNAINKIGKHCALLADSEGLEAHRKSIEIRLEK
ncbi:histidinol dehydrogenase [Helicobacter sp. MIT 14-3879]|uniref:histidinol dehydrogenase n=1 Tax=Helicobacter sp. MIT 14-3879 TaxID=2040649 RepID=UPI000E1E9BC9|nr:histidinol dehydrogenase [Helicobacter sp. MIT 14-3879]RDU64817.1 histidinol dehydrogenase [Helicobacter sp. MIT 14-3879]